MNDFGNIKMKFGNEFWLILFREYISPNLFAVWGGVGNVGGGGGGQGCQDSPRDYVHLTNCTFPKPSAYFRIQPTELFFI